LLTRSEPGYTEAARHAHLQGTVKLRTVLNSKGEPTQISIMRPLGLGLDDEAVRTASAWRFKPAMRNGEPVAVVIEVEFNFRLE
jgi:TonB family protein